MSSDEGRGVAATRSGRTECDRCRRKAAARKTEPRATCWLLRSVPGRLSVREVGAALGDAFTVVDRMLGLRMMVVKRKAGGSGPPVLPHTWVQEYQTSVATYHLKREAACKPRGDTDVVIVHCLKQGALTLEQALHSLMLMRYPLAHVRCVFLGRGTPRRCVDVDGATLHQIYVQMDSVAHARALVPATDPLRPLFDAVACTETGCVLHVLQRSAKEFDESRTSTVYRLPKRSLGA